MTKYSFPTYITAERVGSEYHVKIKGKLVAVYLTPEAFLSGVKLFIDSDPSNDGPEVDIIQRENVIAAEENFDGIAWG